MTNNPTQNNIPRSIYMRLILGDEQYEYIKDEVGVDNFLREQFANQNKMSDEMLIDKDIQKFSSNWFLFVEYYKTKLGKRVRDKDAIDKLKNKSGFESLEVLYKFRNKLFKADFNYDLEFKTELKERLRVLLRIVKHIKSEKRKKDSYLIKNKLW